MAARARPSSASKVLMGSLWGHFGVMGSLWWDMRNIEEHGGFSGGYGVSMGSLWDVVGGYGVSMGSLWGAMGSLWGLWAHQVAEMDDGGGAGAGGGGARGGSHRVVDGHRHTAPLLRHRAAPCGTAPPAGGPPTQRPLRAVLQHSAPNSAPYRRSSNTALITAPPAGGPPTQPL